MLCAFSSQNMSSSTNPQGKKIFFGGKKPAQRVIVRDVQDDESTEERSMPPPSSGESNVVLPRDLFEDVKTPETCVLSLFPWGGRSRDNSCEDMTPGVRVFAQPEEGHLSRVDERWQDGAGKIDTREGNTPCERYDVSPYDDGVHSRRHVNKRCSATAGDIVHLPLVSPVPIDSWKEFEQTIQNSSDMCRGNVIEKDGILRTWLNSVLDPWGTGQQAALGSNVIFHSHKDVLKDRMRHQWMSSIHDDMRSELMAGSLCKVSLRIGRDPIKIAKQVEHVMQSAILHARVTRALQSYSYVWLKLAYDILNGDRNVGCGGEEHVMPEGLSAKEQAWFFRILSIPMDGGHGSTQSTRKVTSINCQHYYYCGKLSPRGYCRVLRHLLAMIVFLDDVFSSTSWTIPVWAPPLFTGRISQDIHSSIDVLQETLGLFLDQVDMERYLRRFGCTVSYVQPLNKCILHHVENLAVDLRDGIKLCRLAEIVSGSKQPLDPIQPAVRTSEKVSNVKLALSIMGLDAPGVPEHIADGNHDVTTGLLWDCIIKFEIPKALNIKSISLECDQIIRESGHVSMQDIESSMRSLENAGWRSHQIVMLVLKWVSCLSISYGVRITDVFSNGRDRISALESFLAFYGDHPARVQHSNMFRTADIFDRTDFILRGTGGIPRLFDLKQYENDPDLDHRQLIVFYALLCKRVLCLNYEHRAAIVIQRFWRRVCHRTPGYARNNLENWINAAKVIQRNVKPFLWRCRIEQSASSRRLLRRRITDAQALWRCIIQMRRYEEMKASSLVIQSHWRTFMTRRMYVSMKERHDSEHAAAVLIQSSWRQYHCSRDFEKILLASARIQIHWKMHQCRKNFLAMTNAAVVVQSHARRLLVLNFMKTQQHAAVVLQSQFRAHRARRDFLDILNATKMIQMHWRRFQAQEEATRTRDAAITIQNHFRKFRDMRVKKIHFMLNHQTKNLSCAMKEFSSHVLAEIRADRIRKAAALQEKKQDSAARTIQKVWRNSRLLRSVSTYLLELYEKSKQKIYIESMYGSAAVVIQAHWRKFLVSKNHPFSENLTEIRRRLAEASERTRMLHEEGIDDPTSLWNMTQRALCELEQRSQLPSKAILQDLGVCLGSSCNCCQVFINRSGVDYLVKALLEVSRDKSRNDSFTQACECLESLSRCGRFVDQVGQILVESGHMEALSMLLFQSRDDHEPFYSILSLFDVLANSRSFVEKVSTSKAIYSKLVGIHRSLWVKHGQVASYLRKLEGRKGSDISAANATRTVFKMQNQISSIVKLLNKFGIRLDDEDQNLQGPIPYKAQGKNTIVRQVLREISNTTRY